MAIRTPNRVIARRPQADVGRKGAPPVAESSDRSGWAGTCLCTNEVQGKGLVPTRKSQSTNGREISDERYFPEIATAPLGPRNDRCGRWSAPELRLPLSLRGGEADVAIRLPAGSHLPQRSADGGQGSGPTAPAGPRNDSKNRCCAACVFSGNLIE